MIGGLVLAAGRGSRFGPDPKLLADIDGQPALQRVVETMTRLGALDPVVVVLGAHAEEILSRVRFGRARTVICARWEEGQSASLQTGVEELGDAERIVVTLADQPLLAPETAARFTREPPGARAVYNGVPGHPVVLGAEHLPAIRRLEGDQGAREILDGPLIESAQDGVPRDLDTHEDLMVIRREAAVRRATGTQAAQEIREPTEAPMPAGAENRLREPRAAMTPRSAEPHMENRR